MKKLKWQDIPELPSGPSATEDDDSSNGSESESESESEIEIEGRNNDRHRFDRNYIKSWWDQYLRLDEGNQPAFCPSGHFASLFVSLSETDFVAILWHRSCKAKQALEMKVCSKDIANTLATTDYGALFHKLFVGDRKAIKHSPRKAQTSYGKRTSTMSKISSTRPSTHGNSALREYLRSWYHYLRDKKVAGSEAIAPTFPERPETCRRYAISNILHTNGLELNTLAFDTWKGRQGRKSKVYIRDVTKAYPDMDKIEETFRFTPHDTVVVGIDPGEHITASFCAIDPRDPDVVTNLLVKRKALYAPILAHRSQLQQLKTNIGIDDIECSLTRCEGVDYEDGLANFYDTFEQLHAFYNSKPVKKMAWERRKAFRAEKDRATSSALTLASQLRPCLFVFGNGAFNTHRNLASLHQTFKGHFYQKAKSLGYEVVQADEFYTSTKCPPCAARGIDVRLAKPTRRTCVCLEPGCRRWIDRDSVGAQNIAQIGHAWLTRMERPVALRRPAQ
ncbi:hypothetical protein BGX34_010580 [Mortierella sp. NVP85]|nr:hypothetical protein BGX34_010580 [Mortierella sp. NVP85]